MASAIQNPLYACVSSWEAADVVSRGRAAMEVAAQAETRISAFDREVKRRKRSFVVAILMAKREVARRESKLV